MSAIVFAGSAQFAVVSILGGGGAGAALAAAALMNSRFLPMGAALAPSLPGGGERRGAGGAAAAQAGIMSSEMWLIVAGTALVTAVSKAAGPIALGGRELPAWADGVIGLLAPALLAALIVTQAFADGDRLAVGAQTAGVVVAGIAFARGASILVGIALAVVVTVLLRAVG